MKNEELLERLKLWKDLLEEDCNWLGLDDEPLKEICALIEHRPMVDELLKYWGTVDVHRKICDTDLGWYIGKLQEAGVEIKEGK